MAMKINDTENEDDINEGNRDDNSDTTQVRYIQGFITDALLNPL